MTDTEIQPQNKTEPRFFYGYIVVTAGLFTQIILVGMLQTFGIFFKPLIAEFGWSRALLSGVSSVSQIVQGLCGIIAGGLNDRFGPRVVMTIVGFMVGVGYLLLSQIHTAWHLYLIYVFIIGIGMGGFVIPVVSTIARWFTGRRSMMMGIAMAGGGIGQVIMPPLATWLIATQGWRHSFMTLGPMILVIVVLAAQFLKRDPAQMGLAPYGDDKVSGPPKPSLPAAGLSLREAAHTKHLWMVAAMLFSYGFAFMAIAIHLVPHITDLGISAASAANVVSVMGLTTIAGGVAIGIFTDRRNSRQAWVICFILLEIVSLWLLVARAEWMFYPFALVLGFIGGGLAISQSSIVAELFGIRSHGLIWGAVGIGYTAGGALGPYIAGHIYDTTGSYQTAFIINAVLVVIGLAIAVILQNLKKPEIKTQPFSIQTGAET